MACEKGNQHLFVLLQVDELLCNQTQRGAPATKPLALWSSEANRVSCGPYRGEIFYHLKCWLAHTRANISRWAAQYFLSVLDRTLLAYAITCCCPSMICDKIAPSPLRLASVSRMKSRLNRGKVNTGDLTNFFFSAIKASLQVLVHCHSLFSKSIKWRCQLSKSFDKPTVIR